MALPHAAPLEIIDLSHLDEKLPTSMSTSLIKTDKLQLMHLVMQSGQQQPLHHIAGECTVHCLQGQVDLVFPGGSRTLKPRQLVAIPAQHDHFLRAGEQQAAVLVTLLLHQTPPSS